MSETDNRCASFDYLNGLCMKLEKEDIGCQRGFWNENARLNEHTSSCESVEEKEDKVWKVEKIEKVEKVEEIGCCSMTKF